MFRGLGLQVSFISFRDIWYFYSRFPSSPLIIRVPFFLLFGLNKGNQKKKGKRVLLGHLRGLNLGLVVGAP